MKRIVMAGLVALAGVARGQMVQGYTPRVTPKPKTANPLQSAAIERAAERKYMRMGNTPQVLSQEVAGGKVVSTMTDGRIIVTDAQYLTTVRIDHSEQVRLLQAATELAAEQGADSRDTGKLADALQGLRATLAELKAEGAKVAPDAAAVVRLVGDLGGRIVLERLPETPIEGPIEGPGGKRETTP